MSADERRALEALKDVQHTEDAWQDENKEMGFGDVLDGTEPLPISHGGGEFADLARDLLGDFRNT